MLVVLKVVNALAFAFVSYLLADVLAKALKEGSIVKPFSITVCAITISYHLLQTDGAGYIVAAFVGFFIHTCANAYVRKKKKPMATPKKDKKVININP
tara:strand:+ start:342 stop:635 length:294 start_codon:yes stop_codon:yes gene_type:complete